MKDECTKKSKVEKVSATMNRIITVFLFTAFHFMRDHPAHSIEVLGSGWGVRMSQLERSFIDAGFMTAVKDPIFWAPRGAYGPDQGFLKR